jgi:hypothetical protein
MSGAIPGPGQAIYKQDYKAAVTKSCDNQKEFKIHASDFIFYNSPFILLSQKMQNDVSIENRQGIEPFFLQIRMWIRCHGTTEFLRP